MRFRLNNEGGGLVFHTIVILPLILIFGALLVDLLLLERALRSLQVAADAAALGGALQLDRTESGTDGTQGAWLKAKRGTFGMLRNNPLFFVPGEYRNPGYFGASQGGVEDTLDDPAEFYRFTVFRFSNLTMFVERGVLVGSGSGRQFRSLETGSSVCPVGIPACQGGARTNFEVANAVRVRLMMNTLPTFLAGGALGIASHTNIAREAVAGPR